MRESQGIGVSDMLSHRTKADHARHKTQDGGGWEMIQRSVVEARLMMMAEKRGDCMFDPAGSINGARSRRMVHAQVGLNSIPFPWPIIETGVVRNTTMYRDSRAVHNLPVSIETPMLALSLATVLTNGLKPMEIPEPVYIPSQFIDSGQSD
ncbi:MAG: hypothetical protein Q9184_007449 [Pyrenodesmia sp. 2 TL-2023]